MKKNRLAGVPGLGRYLPAVGKPEQTDKPGNCRNCGTKLIGGELDPEANRMCDVCRME